MAGKKVGYDYKIEQYEVLTAFKGQMRAKTVYSKIIINMWKRVTGLFKSENLGETILTTEEKRKVSERVKANKWSIVNDLGQNQIPNLTAEAERYIYNTIMQNINNSLEDYIEGLTPYFLR